MNAAIEAKKLAIVITTTSRFWTWVSSWPSTASSSPGLSRFRIPVVAHTVARGREDLFTSQVQRHGVRQKGGGRKPVEKKRPK